MNHERETCGRRVRRKDGGWELCILPPEHEGRCHWRPNAQCERVIMDDLVEARSRCFRPAGHDGWCSDGCLEWDARSSINPASRRTIERRSQGFVRYVNQETPLTFKLGTLWPMRRS